jgi:hypothetical protein
VAALAAGDPPETCGRVICQWTGTLPEKYRQQSDELLVTAAAAGLGLADLSALFAGMYQRARSDLPDEDPAREFADRGVRLETTFQGAGVLTGNLTPECAAVVGKVLDALSAPAGTEDDRTREQRYHDDRAREDHRRCRITYREHRERGQAVPGGRLRDHHARQHPPSRSGSRRFGCEVDPRPTGSAT